jgi:hypothetical protein
VTVEIPTEEAAGFAETLASDEYETTERGYKDAVVRVVGWIFAAAGWLSSRSRFDA